jgi:hypothetical protein
MHELINLESWLGSLTAVFVSTGTYNIRVYTSVDIAKRVACACLAATQARTYQRSMFSNGHVGDDSEKPVGEGN